MGCFDVSELVSLMKILFISHLLPFPLRTGAALRNHGELKELSKNNEVDILSFSQKVLIPDDELLQQSIAATRKICRRLEVLSIPTDCSKWSWYGLLLLNLCSLTPYSVWRFYSRKMARLVQEQCKAENYDIVHIDTIALAQYHAYCGKAKLVLNHHNVESAILFRRAAAEKNFVRRAYVALQAWKLQRYERKLIPRFPLNVCVSELDALALERDVPGIRTFVVPNGTDTDYFSPDDSPAADEQAHSPSLIFVGGMTWFPNLEGMLWFCRDIFPSIVNSVPDVSLSIIGSCPNGEMRQLAADAGNIRLLGIIDDIRPYVQRATVFVVPLRVGGGTRLKILDAMASGKAIVSTSIGAEGLNVRSGEDIVIADDARGFADAVVDLICDKVRRLDLQRTARKRVDELYSWRVIGPQQDLAYRGLVKDQNNKRL